MAAASNLAANSKMAHQNTRDVLDAVSDGGVMLGRNGALVLGPVVGTLHIKFIAPLNKRVERVMYKTGLSEAAAAEQDEVQREGLPSMRKYGCGGLHRLRRLRAHLPGCRHPH